MDEKKNENLNEKWRKVSVKQCISILIYACIAFLVVFIPFAFSGGIKFTISTLPLIGSGEFTTSGGTAIYNLLSKIFNVPLVASVALYFSIVTAYFIMLILDIIFALLLILTKSKALRIVFKIFSIIFSVVFFVVALVNILCVAGLIVTAFTNPNIGTGVADMFKNRGIFAILAMIILSFMFFKMQMFWYSKPAWAETTLEDALKDMSDEEKEKLLENN